MKWTSISYFCLFLFECMNCRMYAIKSKIHSADVLEVITSFDFESGSIGRRSLLLFLNPLFAGRNVRY